ncbi:MAG: c-type cytochrome [Saprospiraceae bacterium]|nr:c-type cytochrome [Saprospiraceae bacterium]
MKNINARLSWISLVLLAIFLSACQEDKVVITKADYTDAEYEVLARTLNLPRERADYSVKLPLHMARQGAAAPVVSSAKATLGAVLFYDTKLSANNTVSCASCHKQSLAFSDDVALSKGFNGELTKRNSLALGSAPNFEVSYNGTSFSSQTAAFFWDERAHSIQEQSILTLQDDIEMGMDLDELKNRLESIPYYNILFTKAFGSGAVTPDRVTDALQQFINGFISGSSRFDEGLNRSTSDPFANFAEFTAQENLGKTLFNTNCSSCHGADFTSVVETVANNGLEMEYADQGIGARTRLDFDNGKFKVPFLRNIALTGPYMHDGRFATLKEVIDHYSEGIQAHENLDIRLRTGFEQNGEPLKMNFNEEEKAALVAFLHTLTDYQFIQDERFADPFK